MMKSYVGSRYICSIRRQSDRTPQRTPPRDFPDGYQPIYEKVKVVMYLRQQLIFVSKYTASFKYCPVHVHALQD